MSDRPIGITYIRDGLAMEEIEGSPRQIAKENSTEWCRLCVSLDTREKAWNENIKKAGLEVVTKKRPSKLKLKKSL